MPPKDPDRRRAYQREYYRRTRKHSRSVRRSKLIRQFGGKCTRCGYDRNHAALQFHHEDPSIKEFSLFSTWHKWADVLQEAKKCILVCANCHLELHDELLHNKPS